MENLKFIPEGLMENNEVNDAINDLVVVYQILLDIEQNSSE